MILVICGPTGVGKTKLSIELAKKYDAIILNADACQVYQKMDIGTAKVTEEEKEGIKHELLSFKNINEDYNICEFQKDGRNILEKYQDRNVIIVGGSGLYISSLLYNYEFNERVELDLSAFTNDELYEQVLKLNPEVKVSKENRVRLENYLKSGHVVTEEPKLLYNAIFIGLTTDRDTLYQKINSRVDEMINRGLVDEVKSLYQTNKNSRVLHSAIGYKEIIKYLDNEITLEDAIDLIKKNSRHYAKRQYTWFNNKMNITWFNTDYNNFDNTINEVIEYIEKTAK